MGHGKLSARQLMCTGLAQTAGVSESLKVQSHWARNLLSGSVAHQSNERFKKIEQISI